MTHPTGTLPLAERTDQGLHRSGVALRKPFGLRPRGRPPQGSIRTCRTAPATGRSAAARPRTVSVSFPQPPLSTVRASPSRTKPCCSAAKVEQEPSPSSTLASVQAFAQSPRADARPIDLLTNDAGVMALPERHTSSDEHELQVATNVPGLFALTGLLLPRILGARAADEDRLVQRAYQRRLDAGRGFRLRARMSPGARSGQD